MLAAFGSSAFVDVNAGVGALSVPISTVLGLLLLLGACGKSAQVPLQSWLLDAMEGPTPVSALIHAATMVTAGVYLVVRSHAIFIHAPAASEVVVIVGTVTLLFGAWIGCAKDDIKKVLAGSTMSQIGYMMLAAGIGPAGYAFAIFHLLTHGFFKANMFLGAGSVMHAMDDDVDMRHYGALARALPITFVTFAAGYLAIIGFPFFAGFYSKDHIIEAAFHASPVAGTCALVGAGVTAFYMTRLMLMTFAGQKRWRARVHPHESPLVMTIPLIILGAASVVGGLVLNGWIGEWLNPAVQGTAETEGLIHPTPIGFVTMAVVLAGIAVSFAFFGPRRTIADVQPATRSPFVRAGRRDLYGDAFNEAVFMRPGIRMTQDITRFDAGVVDGVANGTGTVISGFSGRLRHVQNGFVRTYALTMTAGAAVVGAIILLGRLG
jgi:NADH-quinone oxidoreductase subunit L